MKTKLRAVLVVILMLAVAMSVGATQVFAGPKVVATGSTVDAFSSTAPITILSTTIKTDDSPDLLISVTSECGVSFSDAAILHAQASTGGFGSGSASGNSDTALSANVDVWVEIDGVPVPVAGTDNGRVTFCRLQQTNDGLLNVFVANNAGFGNSTTVGVNIDLRQFEQERAANGFNWLAPKVGKTKKNIHTIAVKAAITENATGSFASSNSFGSVPNTPFVQGVVGKRTLIVQSADD